MQVSEVSMLSPAQIPERQTLSLWLVVVQELQLPQVPSLDLGVRGDGDGAKCAVLNPGIDVP